jgi:hypothetical protein
MPVTPLHSNVAYADGVSRCHYCAKDASAQSPDEVCNGPLPLRLAPARGGERDLFYLHWLLHAYETIRRAGWEDGYTHEELSTELLHVLCNSGLHPTDDKAGWMALAKANYGRVPPAISGTLAEEIRSLIPDVGVDKDAFFKGTHAAAKLTETPAAPAGDEMGGAS